MDIEKIKLSPEASIREALRIIDSGAVKIALVVDEAGRLLGTVTDGDIRRAILAGAGLEDPIAQIYSKDPVTVPPSASNVHIINLCSAYRVYQIPVVDEAGRPVDMILLDEVLKSKNYPNKVVLMVGGLGTRLRPLTEKTPKPMLSVGGKPILQTIVEQFAEYGFSDIIMCVNYRAEAIYDYFGDGRRFGVRISYIKERERMGTAGALSLLPERPKEPFFVMNGDILTNVRFDRFLEYHMQNGATASMCVREYDMQVPFGVVEMEGNRITAIREKPVYRFFVNAGIYLLSPETLDYIPEQSYFDMPTLFERLMQAGHKCVSFPLREYWLDIGRMEEYERANSEYKEVF